MADAHANFAYSTVATAPSPATSGTSLVVAAAQGALFPATPFNAVICPVSTQPTAANAEIVRVTNRSTDTFTITRTQESSSARTVIVGDQIFAGVTAKTLTDAETPTLTSSSNYVSGSVTMTTSATYYDGPTLTLAAGTWLLTGAVLLLGSTTASRTWKVRLWDGTTDTSHTAHTTEGTAATSMFPVPLAGIVTPVGSTTYKISATSTVNSDQILAGGSGTTLGSYLLAVKIA